MQDSQYPLHSDHGSEGRMIAPKVNHFQVKIPKGLTHHYDISIQPDNCSQSVNREIVETMVQKSFNGQRPFFDGRKNLYSQDPLPVGREKVEFEVTLPGEGQDRVFHVAIKLVAQKSLYALDETREGKVSLVPADAVQALHVLMRHLSSMTYTPVAVGRSIFSPPKGYSHTLGGGPEVWFGFHQSVHSSYWKMLNIDDFFTSNNGNGSLSGLGNGLPCSGSMSNDPGSGSSSGFSFGSIRSSTGNSSRSVLLGLGNGGMETMLGLENGLGGLQSLHGTYGPANGTLQLLDFQFPLHSDHGSEGRMIAPKVNHFQIGISKGFIYHYDISIQPDNYPRRVNREIVETMVRAYSQKVFNGQRPVFDGRKNLFSRDPLPIGREKVEFKVKLPGEGQDRVFHVAIKFVAQKSLFGLEETLEGKGSQIPANAVQILHVLMRHLPSMTYTPVGRSISASPEGYSHLLSGGPEVWFWFHQSVGPSYWKILNIDAIKGAILRGFLDIESPFHAPSLDNQTRVHIQLESSGVTTSSDVTAQSMGVRIQLPPSTGMPTGTCDSSYVDLHADRLDSSEVTLSPDEVTAQSVRVRWGLLPSTGMFDTSLVEEHAAVQLDSSEVTLSPDEVTAQSVRVRWGLLPSTGMFDTSLVEEHAAVQILDEDSDIIYAIGAGSALAEDENDVD